MIVQKNLSAKVKYFHSLDCIQAFECATCFFYSCSCSISATLMPYTSTNKIEPQLHPVEKWTSSPVTKAGTAGTSVQVDKVPKVDYFTCLNIKLINYITALALAGNKKDFLKKVIVFISHWGGITLAHAIIQAQQQALQ